MNELKDWLSIISSAVMLIGMIFLVYKTFRDPDIKTESDLGIMKEGCRLKHEGLDKEIKNINCSLSGLNKTFLLFKENEFKHIEDRMNSLDRGQIRIETILNERLPKK